MLSSVGSGGAFASGSARLTVKAREIMNQIAEVNKEGTSRLTSPGIQTICRWYLVRNIETIGILQLRVPVSFKSYKARQD